MVGLLLAGLPAFSILIAVKTGAFDYFCELLPEENRMLRIFLIAFCLTSLSTISVAQFTSIQDGNWNDGATWGNNSPGVEGVDFPGATDNATISSNVTIVGVQSANSILIGAGFTLQINSGGSLSFTNTLEIEDDGLGGNGFLIISGTLRADQGSTFINDNPSSVTVTSSGVYQHNYSTSAGNLLEAIWESGSTCSIIGYTSNSSPPGKLNQAFHHFIFNCPLTTTFFSFNGLLTNVNGNFTVLNTGGSTRTMRFFDATSSNTLSIGGNLSVQNNSRVVFSSSGTGNVVNIGGNFLIASNATTVSTIASTGSCTLNVSGSFSLSSSSGTATLALNSTSTPGSGIVNVTGDFTLGTGGVISRSSTIGGIANINFVGTGVRNYSNSGTYSGAINFSVGSGATLTLGNSFLAGSGNLALNGAIRVGSTDPNGAIQISVTNGNIRVSGTRTYSPGSTIEYNGNAAQFIGDGHPSLSGVNTIINNSSGVSLASNVTISGNLTLTSGNLNVGNNTLTLGGNVTPNANFISVTSASSLVINGSGAFGTFPFPAGDQTITNFTLNRSSGSVTFGRNVTITGATVLNNGNLIFNNQTLTLNGSFSSGGGALSSNSASTLTIGGTGAFGELLFAVGGNTLNTFNFSRSSGSASINSSLTITTAFNLQDGDFTNSTGLSLANNATLTRNSTAQFLGVPIVQGAGEFYNVVYTGSTLSTGVELPTTGDDNLDNLTINGGPVTLTQNIIVNGDLILQNSSLNGNGFNITMAGSPGVWNRQLGSFTPGSGTVFIAGNISVQASSAPQFGNLIINSGATFTARAGSMNISGNLQIDAASTFNHNGGTLTFGGGTTQTLAGANKTFNNITVNKSGGNLQLSSTVNLLGAFVVSSATTIESGGSLRLLSSSDGTSGNARIGSLPAGASITGNVTVQRYIADEGRIYRYISAPVSGFTVAQLQSEFPVTGSFTGSSTCSGCTTNSSMFAYDETVAGGVDNGYFQFPVSSNTEALQVGRGYAPFVRDDIIPGNVTIDWVGPVNQGSIALPVTYTNTGDATADGYNLVGNPFPSSIDWDNASGWTKTNISNVIAVRDNGAGGVFRYWDGSGGTFAGGEIATGQAFWVRATGASPALVVNEQAKTSTTATFYREKDIESMDHLLMIALTMNNITDYAFLRYRPQAFNILDDFDAPKLNNASFDMYTFSEEGIPMAINAVNTIACGQSMALGIKDMPNGTFTFSREAFGFFEQFDFYLKDNFTGVTTKLASNEVYEFVTNSDPASKAENRFSFELKVSVPVRLEAVDGTLYSNYQTGNMWYRNGQLIEGETGASFTPENPGLYTLKVKIGTCEFTAPESYVITGVGDQGKKSIRVFPNPAKNKVKLEVDSSFPVSVRLLNPLGVQVAGRELSGDGFIKQTEFDLSGQSNGMYILHVLKEGRMHHVKIIKTNE